MMRFLISVALASLAVFAFNSALYEIAPFVWEQPSGRYALDHNPSETKEAEVEALKYRADVNPFAGVLSKQDVRLLRSVGWAIDEIERFANASALREHHDVFLRLATEEMACLTRGEVVALAERPVPYPMWHISKICETGYGYGDIRRFQYVWDTNRRAMAYRRFPGKERGRRDATTVTAIVEHMTAVAGGGMPFELPRAILIHETRDGKLLGRHTFSQARMSVANRQATREVFRRIGVSPETARFSYAGAFGVAQVMALTYLNEIEPEVRSIFDLDHFANPFRLYEAAASAVVYSRVIAEEKLGFDTGEDLALNAQDTFPARAVAAFYNAGHGFKKFTQNHNYGGKVFLTARELAHPGFIPPPPLPSRKNVSRNISQGETQRTHSSI